MKTIKLKTWPEYFKQVLLGTKTFELRKDDRDYEVCDVLILEEYDPSTELYTGSTIECIVTYIIRNDIISSGMNVNISNLCIMSIKVLDVNILSG